MPHFLGRGGMGIWPVVADEVVGQDASIGIPADATPGTYRILMGVYDLSTGTRCAGPCARWRSPRTPPQRVSAAPVASATSGALGGAFAPVRGGGPAGPDVEIRVLIRPWAGIRPIMTRRPSAHGKRHCPRTRDQRRRSRGDESRGGEAVARHARAHGCGRVRLRPGEPRTHTADRRRSNVRARCGLTPLLCPTRMPLIRRLSGR